MSILISTSAVPSICHHHAIASRYLKMEAPRGWLGIALDGYSSEGVRISWWETNLDFPAHLPVDNYGISTSFVLSPNL